MRHHSFLHVWLAVMIVMISLFSFVRVAEAKGSATVGTTLTFEAPVPISIGNPSIIVLLLVSSKGEPVVNQPVELFINGEAERRARTDSLGRVAFRVQRDVAGTYSLSATFTGSKLPSLGSS